MRKADYFLNYTDEDQVRIITPPSRSFWKLRLRLSRPFLLNPAVGGEAA
jgi:hypothetical protein